MSLAVLETGRAADCHIDSGKLGASERTGSYVDKRKSCEGISTCK